MAWRAMTSTFSRLAIGRFWEFQKVEEKTVDDQGAEREVVGLPRSVLSLQPVDDEYMRGMNDIRHFGQRLTL